jgi:hypothetical protein
VSGEVSPTSTDADPALNIQETGHLALEHLYPAWLLELVGMADADPAELGSLIGQVTSLAQLIDVGEAPTEPGRGDLRAK